ncbi:MAG: flagellar hook assembly protein FlgD [Thermotogaceae bacterium]|nr:flagellar hook assembly protein FlgD [Thermotogaceae bacterium]
MINDLSSVYLNSLYGANDGSRKRELDKQAFLELLITELKNQNPLEPLDNKDLVAQLTQLTSLEQISNMTKSVTDFIKTNIGLMKAQSSSMIGKTVVVRANNIDVSDGKAPPIYFKLDEPARVVLKIVDSNGKEVFYKDFGELNEGLQYYVWDTKNNEGVALPDGVYYYSVYKINPDGTQEDIGGLESGKVEAVQFEGENIYILVDGKRYPVSSIIEVSEEG